ncbi:MAG: hypothetical protein JW768_03275 [Chitinispirillaceae bacterium]|nr:hypothetical protein [Chitinispirillaceae bacterium]
MLSCTGYPRSLKARLKNGLCDFIVSILYWVGSVNLKSSAGVPVVFDSDGDTDTGADP